jgi:hypothetical protein
VPEDLLEEVQYQDLPLLASIYFYNVWEMWANVGNKMELRMGISPTNFWWFQFVPAHQGSWSKSTKLLRRSDSSTREYPMINKWLERYPWTKGTGSHHGYEDSCRLTVKTFPPFLTTSFRIQSSNFATVGG